MKSIKLSVDSYPKDAEALSDSEKTVSRSESRLKRVCVVGGGHGLEASLKAALMVAESVVAVVGVSDDGGSSGRIRNIYGLIPPGDMRRCMSSLMPDESKLKRLLEYRFETGELEGHALGNLIFVAALDIAGSTSSASELIGELFGAQGSVYPAANHPLVLGANLKNGRYVKGQVEVHFSEDISEVWIDPADPDVPQRTLDAIMSADLVLLGPGSLFTSVIAACVVPKVKAVLDATSAKKIMVCNLKEQVAETVGLSIADQIDAILRHSIPLDAAVYDPSYSSCGDLSTVPVDLLSAKLSTNDGQSHDPKLLAENIIKIS